MYPAIAADPALLNLAGHQGGLVTAEQARRLGMTRTSIDRHIRQGRWLRLGRGVLQLHPGPLDFTGRAWGGVLLAGDGAAVAGHAAAHLHGFADPPRRIAVVTGHDFGLRLPAGYQHVRRCLDPNPHGSPPRTSPEATVLYLCSVEPERSTHWITAAVNARVSTAPRLRRELERRAKLPGRAGLNDLLTDVADGVRSPLEAVYRRDVERAHGLPRAHRQARSGGYLRDAAYDEGLVVELDGRLGHEPGTFRDLARDNYHALRGETTLRFGWHDCRTRPCEVAFTVAAVLTRLGWSGSGDQLPPLPGPAALMFGVFGAVVRAENTEHQPLAARAALYSGLRGTPRALAT